MQCSGRNIVAIPGGAHFPIWVSHHQWLTIGDGMTGNLAPAIAVSSERRHTHTQSPPNRLVFFLLQHHHMHLYPPIVATLFSVNILSIQIQLGFLLYVHLSFR